MGRFECRLMGAALLFAVALVVVLALQERGLTRKLSLSQARAESMLPGAFAPLVRVPSLAGDTIQMGRTAARALVYLVYNTRCPYCERSLSAWKELHERFSDSMGVRVLGVSLDSANLTLQYEWDHSLGFPSVLLLDSRTKDAHRFGVVPQTVILDSDGRVVLSRIGVLELGLAADSVFAVLDGLLGDGLARPGGR